MMSLKRLSDRIDAFFLRQPARSYLFFVAFGAILAIGYCTINYQAGLGIASGLGVGRYGDLFGDYLKFMEKFPGGDAINRGALFGWNWLDIRYVAPDPDVVQTLPPGYDKLWHGMPITTLFCLLSVQIMHGIGGMGGLILTYAVLGAYWYRLAMAWGGNRSDGLIWMLMGLVSYPVLFMLVRGNVYAGFAGIFLIHGLLLAYRREAPVLAAVLIAIAINIRPNAVLFALPLFLFHWEQIKRVLPVFCLASGGIFALGMAIAHYVYPEYGLSSFLKGLGIYYKIYVVGGAGLGFGSSLFGAAKALISFQPGLDQGALLLSLTILPPSMWFWYKRRLSDAGLLFMVAASYTLGTSVIADYHLLVFMVPLMVSVREKAQDQQAGQVIVIASILMLLSKNFLYLAGVSLQVIVNPLILLCVVTWILMRALHQSHLASRLSYKQAVLAMAAIGLEERNFGRQMPMPK